MTKTAGIPLQKNSGTGSYVLILAIMGILGFVVFKNISLPRAVTLPIAAIGVTGLFFAGFSKPQFAFLILTAYLPFSKVIIGQFGSGVAGLNLTNMIMILLIAGWVIKSFTSKEKMLTNSSLGMLILMFFLWGVVGVFRANSLYGDNYPLDSFFILFKRWATPLLLYFISFNLVKNREDFKKSLFVIMTITLIVALMAIRDYMNSSGNSSLEDSRVGGVFDQANMLGAFFVYNMFFFAGFVLYYWRSLKYYLFLIPFFLCFRGIMVTFSRGAYMAFAFGSLMLAFFRSKVLFIAAIGLIFAAILNPSVLPEGVQYRLEATFKGDRIISTDVADIKDSSAGKRILIWRGAMGMIKDQPLFGFGYGLFPYIIGQYSPETPNTDAHNTYLILAAEMGVPAFLIFLSILFVLIKNARWLLLHAQDKYFKAFAIGALAGLFGLIMANMFGSRLNTEEVSSYFWIIGGLIMRAVLMKKNGEIA